MKARRLLLSGLFFAAMVVSGGIVAAQQSNTQSPVTPTAIATLNPSNPFDNGGPSPNVVISSPRPVSLVSGQVTITGTANLPGMTDYYLETRPLNADLSVPAPGVPWIPATLPVTSSVTNGTLATWDTSLVPDGIYQLRLTVNVDNQPSVSYIVAPISVDNSLNGTPQPTITPVPTTAASTSNAPTVTALVNANVRSGDNVAEYPPIGYLLTGHSAPVVGVSDDGSGWYYIEFAANRYGWISPVVVSTSGNFSDLPPVAPPPVPTPTPPPPPVYYSNIVLNGIALKPNPPTCNQDFTVEVNVANTGNGVSSEGVVDVQDVYLGNGQVTTSGSAAYPALTPGENWVVTVTLSVDTYYNNSHQIQAIGNTGSQITASYTLARGNCGKSAATPAPSRFRNVVLNSVTLNPNPPTCDQSFTVQINMTNVGKTRTPAGHLRVRDVVVGTGHVTASGNVAFPALKAGASFAAEITLKVKSGYNKTHLVHVVAPNGNQISASYTLGAGKCAKKK